MQSARELVFAIEQTMLMQDKAVRLENAQALIRSRDREIVEKCKVAAELASSRTYRDGITRSEAVAEALDAILRDLEA